MIDPTFWDGPFGGDSKGKPEVTREAAANLISGLVMATCGVARDYAKALGEYKDLKARNGNGGI